MAITVYSKPNCPACTATARWLDRRGLAYTVESFDKSERAQALAAERGFTAAPVVMAGSRSWAGFRPDLIDRLPASAAEPESEAKIDIEGNTLLINALWNFIKTLIGRQQRRI